MNGSVLVLLRHGATEWSEDARFTSRTDVGLSAGGVIEAESAAAAVASANLSWSRILSSPAARALATAELVAAHLGGLRPVVDERLREVDFGPFEGTTVAEAETGELAEAFAQWRRREGPSFPAGAETFRDAAKRAQAVFDDLRRSDGNILVVGHGYSLRLMIAECVLAMPLPEMRRLRLDTGRFAVIRFEDDVPRLWLFNVADLALASTG